MKDPEKSLGVFHLSIIELRIYRSQTQMGDAVRLPARGSDQPTFLEAIKGGQAAICQHMTVAVKASDSMYFAV